MFIVCRHLCPYVHILCLWLFYSKDFIQGVFFNWCPPKIHKYGKKLKYQNRCPLKNSKYQPVRKFWHLGLLWWDLLCNLTLRTFWGGTSWDLEIIGGHQFESSKHFTYRKTLTTFRGAPVKKDTLYICHNSYFCMVLRSLAGDISPYDTIIGLHQLYV